MKQLDLNYFSMKPSRTSVLAGLFLFLILSFGFTCAENGKSKNAESVSANARVERQNSVKGVTSPTLEECITEDIKQCEKDKPGMEAIKSLHLMIDDDHNGNVDQSESDEFLRDELQYTDGFERQALFHNNDKLVSVDDLWTAWKHSIVHNWTVDDVLEWLIHDVDLPQYRNSFHNNGIDGTFLPRLVNSTSSLMTALGIRKLVHKQKLSLKAMDCVLFGAPKRVHSFFKDLLLISSLIIAIGGCWFAWLHHRYSQTQVKKMMKDLESLQKAEESLKKLSKELADAEKNQRSVPQEKQEEMRMLRVQNRISTGDLSPTRLSREGSKKQEDEMMLEGEMKGERRQEGERKLQEAQEELAILRDALSEAENKLEIQQHMEAQWCVPTELQAWLQMTYEFEQINYNSKRQAAERQLLSAKDGCDKIKKRNKAFFGSLRMAHSNSLDDIDQSILDARVALEEVKQDLNERMQRWHTVELLCGFPIISNPGLAILKQTLGRDGSNPSNKLNSSMLAPISIDEGDEDMTPSVLLGALQNSCSTGSGRPRSLQEENNGPDSSIYQKIPEKQRQRIFAWARRSRLRHSTLSTCGAPSKSFLKQQCQVGSTNSLAHVGKASQGQQVLMRRESRENELQLNAQGVPPSSVSFHLGEGSSTSHHERSHSNTSSVHLTNGHHAHSHHLNHSIAHTKANPIYPHSLSFPPAGGQSYATMPSPTQMSNMSSKHSSMTALSHSSLHHGLSQPPTTRTNGISHGNGSNSYNNFSAGLHNNHQHLASSMGATNEGHHVATTAPVAPNSLTLTMSSKLSDNGDVSSVDSFPQNNQHSSRLGHSPLERSPELDLSSLETDSINNRSFVNDAEEGKKLSKKKKFLQQFLRKSSRKQKTS